MQVQLQKEAISTQKTAWLKRVRPCWKWPVGKKLQNQRGQFRNGCRLMAKISTTSIQVNFGLIHSEAGMRQHKLTCIVDNKIFAIYLYHHSHFLTAPFVFTTFFVLAILNKATPFLQPSCFWVSRWSFQQLLSTFFSGWAWIPALRCCLCFLVFYVHLRNSSG